MGCVVVDQTAAILFLGFDQRRTATSLTFHLIRSQRYSQRLSVLDKFLRPKESNWLNYKAEEEWV